MKPKLTSEPWEIEAYNSGMNKDEVKANDRILRLIAAAPELYEALNNLIDACWFPGNRAEVDKAIISARSIIKKVDGEE